MARDTVDAISVEMLHEDHIYGHPARARNTARRGNCTDRALTCCLVSILILAGLIGYLFICQIQTPKEGCKSKVPRGVETTPISAPFYSPPEVHRDKPRAHLTVAVQKPDTISTSENFFPVLRWQDRGVLAFTKNWMNYTSKFLVIPESGEYFVYSHVTFRGGKTCDKNSLKPQSIIVAITMVSDRFPHPMQLLRGTKSVCETGDTWFQPIYLGAMFSLREGDKLMVNVSDTTLVDYTTEEKTFFGSFLL
ncbi:tumor necrosis factor ligand superfamily member 15 [Suncus etruscus]|uniref:tumor necrosis factor ligand superfamily member 15 n=1 Tax=Suncus etruscus TaxID=109475 RepID=UPI00210F33E2|nr:tumor necrosis factor ligand superfamily member 15 [Suncus etruscus]